MFERATRLFEKTPQPAKERAREIVSESLYESVYSPEGSRLVAAVAETDEPGERGRIYRELLAKEDEVLARLQPLLESWRRADSQLMEVTGGRELGVVQSRGRLQALALLTLAAVCLELIVLFLLLMGLPLSQWDFQFDRSDRELLVLAIILPLITYQPLYWVLDEREKLRRWREIPTLEAERDAAEKRFEVAAVHLAADSIRETLNDRFTSFSTNFQVLDSRGLRALADPEREVSTTARKELSTLLASLSSGSIGLAGPRGVGKTTLIESFARGRSLPFERKRIGLVVSAPVKYDAKEFVLHLFASLCERVIGEERIRYLQSRERVSLQDRRRAGLIGAFGIATLLIAAVAVAMLVFDKTMPETPRETAYVLLAVAGLMASGWIWAIVSSDIDWEGLGMGWARLLVGSRYYAPLGTPQRRAQNLLEQIRFQQSISSSLSGAAKLPFGTTVGAESSVTMARTPWSLPEAVESFRRYAESLAEDSYLVIGIDELDKMGSDASAKEFLNNVKGVFGVSGCYYLVSISDDAMAGFERRGMPVRDVFDSSFDAVQRVGYLTLEESRAVIGSRVIGLPIPYQCLCHCLAGGLPRDLVRITRELVHQAEAKEIESLRELARAVVGAELRAKRAGAIEVSRESSGDQSEKVQMWLDEQGEVVDPERLEESVTRLGDRWAGIESPALPDLAFEVATFDYYAATVLELFNEARLSDLLQATPESNEIDPRAADIVETLAKARQQFAISSGLAWERIAEAREKMALAPWDDPRLKNEVSFGGAAATRSPG
jgi:hypothetical protein